MASSNTNQHIRPKKIWWLVGVIILLGCILIQTPALWLVQRFAPNVSYLQYVSGNVWQGSAILKIPTTTTSSLTSKSSTNSPVSGALTWQWRPSGLLLGKLTADVEFTSGQTRLEGRVSRGLNKWQLQEFSGKIDRDTLASVVSWQLPNAPIQVNALNASLHEENGFSDVDGQLTWVGGELGYPSGGKVFNIILPSMRADINQETRNNENVIHANLVDVNSKRLGDFYLDNKGMLDVNLTQRLLENMPTYKGNAPADTAVVSVRQPLFKNSLATGNDLRDSGSDAATAMRDE